MQFRPPFFIKSVLLKKEHKKNTVLIDVMPSLLCMNQMTIPFNEELWV